MAERSQKKPIVTFSEAHPLNSSVSWACMVYSLVPYIGILFVPFTILFGGVEFIRSRNFERRGTMPLILSLPIVAVQLGLWWLLYLIPEIGL